jgi:lantibiotic modifying enzyme
VKIRAVIHFIFIIYYLIIVKNNWQPIFSSGETYEKIEVIILKIVKDLKENFPNEKKIGFLQGRAGLLCFMHFANIHYNKNIFDEEIDILFENSVRDLASDKNIDIDYCAGLGGFLWGVSFFKKIEFMDLQDENLISDLETILKKRLLKNAEIKNFDFLAGACGYLLYFIEANKLDICEVFISIFLKHLEVSETGSLKLSCLMKTSQDSYYSAYNMGIAHGMCGIIGTLSALYEKKPSDQLREVIEKIFLYYLENINPNVIENSLFPDTIEKTKKISYNSRLAWCYGDLGIGMIFYIAGKRINNKMIENKSLEILRTCINKRQPEITGVKDADFCHGASGIAHIFNRLYQHTGELEFKLSAEFWINQTLNFSIFTDGYAGYKAFHSNKMEKSLGIVSGVSGIGLVLLGCIGKIEPVWDRSLLIS